MDAQELRNLQEAYMEVVMNELNEGAAGAVAARAQKLANQRKGQTPERKGMYQSLADKARDREERQNPTPMRSGVGVSRFERSQKRGPQITPASSQRASSKETLGGGTYERGPQRLPKSKEKYRRQVATGVRAASSQEKKRLGVNEDFDIYDIILSHLLDEGYAETPEAAEAIMVNMSEDWRESIVEAKSDEGLSRDEKRAARSERGTVGYMHPLTRGDKKKKGRKDLSSNGKYSQMQHINRQNQRERDADEQRRRNRDAMSRGTWDRD